MGTMSRVHSEKLRAIRIAEGLTQPAMAELIGIGLSTIKNYETGQKEVGLAIIDKVTNHPRFEKYTLWLMTDKTVPSAGQIAPPLSPNGPDDTKSSHSGQKAG